MDTTHMTDDEHTWFSAQRRHLVYSGDVKALRALYATAAEHFPGETFTNRGGDLTAARGVAQNRDAYGQQRAETVKAPTVPVDRWG